MNPQIQRAAYLTRRQFFSKTATGIGSIALASLLQRDGFGSLASGAAPRRMGGLEGLPHFAPKAKHVIYLLQNGGPPHLDLYDYKPGMEKFRGQEIPPSILGDKRFSTMTQNVKQKLVLPSFTGYKQYGKAGTWVGDFMPHIGSMADDLCFIKSMHTEAVNHAPAISLFLTGAEQPGRPSMGAWATYGLGTESEELPGFVVMTSRDGQAAGVAYDELAASEPLADPPAIPSGDVAEMIFTSGTTARPKAVIIVATEDSWEHTIVPRLMAADADLDRVFRVDVSTSDDVDTGLTLPKDVAALERHIRDVDAALVLLDPVMSKLAANLDTHKDAEVRLALEPIVAIADKTHAAVLGIIHVNKGTSGDALTLIMGSRAFVPWREPCCSP